MSQKAVFHQVTTVQTHLVQQRDVLQSLTFPLSKSGAAGARLDGALLRCLRAAGGHEQHRSAPSAERHRQYRVVNVQFHSPVSVPLSIFIIRYGVQVREGDDVTAVRAQPLLVEATFPVLQLALVLVGDADVGVVVFHAHSSHGWVVALQELVVHPLVMLREIDG